MKKNQLLVLFLFIAGFAFLTGCKSSDDEGSAAGPLVGRWTVGTGSSVDDSGTDVTADFSEYYIQFNSDNSYELNTLDTDGSTYRVTSGTYNYDQGAGVITLSNDEALSSVVLDATAVTLSFNQNGIFTKGNKTLGFSNLVK